MLGGGIVLLVVGLLFIGIVQFMIMPSPTSWENASEDMKDADVGETMWIEGEITFEEEEGSGYNYTFDDVDQPIKSTEDLGDEGDVVTVEVKKSESTFGGEYIRVNRIATGYPPLFYIGIGLAIIGGILIAVTYFKSGKEDIEEETPTPPEPPQDEEDQFEP